MNPVDEFCRVEIDEQTNGDVEQLHVAKELRLMNRHNLIHGFQLEEETALNEKIEAKRLLKLDSLVSHGDRPLRNGANSPQPYFS